MPTGYGGRRPSRSLGYRWGDRTNLRAIAGGVLIQPADAPLMNWTGGRWGIGTDQSVQVNPMDADAVWIGQQLDRNPYSKLAGPVLLQKLVDISPDIGKAYYDHLLFMNPGWNWKVYPAGSSPDDGVAELVGPEKAALAGFFQTLKARHKTIDVVFERLFGAGLLRGAYLGELVLDKATARIPLDIATPDPAVIRWKRVQDVDFGIRWQMGQYDAQHTWFPLEDPTIAYIPIQPMPDTPWGRPLFGQAMFTALFTLAILHDARRVIQQQGWPRIDLKINLERLVAGMPEEDRADPEKFRGWVEAVRDEVMATYAALEPDDAYIHVDMVEVGRPVGTVDSASLGGLDTIIRFLERQIVRALKTVPLLLGINEATTETHANRQWDVFSAGIEALQHRAESLMEYLLQTALNVMGYQGRVEFRFAQLRGSEAQRDLAVAKAKAELAAYYYDRGWIDNNDSASLGMEKPEAEEDTPRAVGKDAYPGSAVDQAKTDAATAAAKARADALNNQQPGNADQQAATKDAQGGSATGKGNGNGASGTKALDLDGFEVVAQAELGQEVQIGSQNGNGHRAPAEKFTPKDGKLPAKPKKRTKFSQDEIATALTVFDDVFDGTYAGLLDAALIGETDGATS